MIHPPGWRNAGGGFAETHDLLWRHDVVWISMHGLKEGAREFGVSTPFDMHVVRKSSTPGFETAIRDMRGGEARLRLEEWDFVPNADFGEIRALLAPRGGERAALEHSYSHYGTLDTCNLSRERGGEFVHPCVYIIPKGSGRPGSSTPTGELRRDGQFGFPKVIFGTDGVGGMICDHEGEFGMTQFAVGLVEKPENLERVRAALESVRFRKLMKSVCVGKAQYNWRVMSLFRKDFWKEFI